MIMYADDDEYEYVEDEAQFCSIHTFAPIYIYIHSIVQSSRSAGIASRDEDWSPQLTG